MPQFGNSWINWGDYLGLNREGAEKQASGLYGEIDQNAGSALTGIQNAEAATKPGEAIDFSAGLRSQANRATGELGAAAGGTYGLQALLQRRRAGTGYTSGMGLMDAALTGSAAGSSFQGLKGKYGDLFGGMEKAQTRHAERKNEHDRLSDTGVTGILDGGPQVTPEEIERDRERKRLRDEYGDQLAGNAGGGGGMASPRTDADPYDAWFERWGR